MIKQMKTNYYFSTVITVLAMFCFLTTKADVIDQKKTRTRLKVYYEKLSNNDRKILVILNQGTGKKISGVQNAEIILTTFDQDEEIALTSLFTDFNGEAVLVIEAGYILPVDTDGYSVINTRYSGNDSLKAAKKQIKFMDMNIAVSFDIVDSVKYLTVSTFEIDSIGKKKPIGGIGLNVGVERLYSTLYLQKIETNEDGTGSMAFPDDIPGDSIGTIYVIVKVDDHDDYGTITKSAKINWGTLVDYSYTLNGRSLFGDEAPLWMIISVFIILAGAWYHFILAIFKVIKINDLEQKSI